jgi:hypothetical protein
MPQGADPRTRNLIVHAAWFLAGLAGCAVAYGRAGSLGWASMPFALLAMAAVASHIWRGDEYERRLAQEASVLVFFPTLAVALAMPLMTADAQLMAARWAWAGLMAFWMLGWAVLRLRTR